MKRPSDNEMQVLSVLWANGPSTVHQVLDNMPDGKKRAYTSILSVLQVMEKKGYLSHDKDGLAHVFKPKVTKAQILEPYVQQIVRNVFGNSKAALVKMLLTLDVTSDELKEIRSAINDAKPAK